MDDGGLFVGNEVILEIDVEAIIPKPTSNDSNADTSVRVAFG